MDDEFEFIDTTPVKANRLMPYHDIAKELGMSLPTVRKIEKQALEKIRKRLSCHPRLEELKEPWERTGWLPRMF